MLDKKPLLGVNLNLRKSPFKNRDESSDCLAAGASVCLVVASRGDSLVGMSRLLMASSLAVDYRL